MPSKKKDRGGEDREKADSGDAARAARRAARDKAFGRGGGETDVHHDDGRDARTDDPLGSLFGRSRDSQAEQESREGSRGKDAVGGKKRDVPGQRRELPMAGSASELRRLRKSGQDIPAMLELIKCDALASEIKKRKRLLYGAMVVVGVGIVVYIAAVFLHLKQVMLVTRFSLLAAPICLGFAINDLCMRLARSNPRLACQILSLLTFGNANSLRNLAHLYMDQGDYSKAEKTLSKSIGAVDAKRKLRDYILMHALFANLRAHIGRTAEAELLVRQVLNAAEAHHKERQTNGSAFLLANTLNYAAQLCDVTDKMHDALALARRAVKLLCDHDMPPADVTLVALYNAGYYCNVIGEFQEAILYLTKAQELATKTGIARDGELAFILSNLAIANLGVGRATQCKRLLSEAETRALAPQGMSERPHTYQCWAIYHFTNDRLEYSLQSYEKAIEYCSQQVPRESVFLLRIIKEYSVLLRELGKTREANANEQRVTQIRDTLHTLSVYVPTKKDKKIKPLKVPVTKKARFPLFTILLAGFLGYMIWGEGVRFAPFTRWLVFLTTLVVIAVKLHAKYGPPVKEETSQGAIIAVVSVIPGLRSVVPELSLIPQRTAGFIIGAALTVLVLVQVTAPAPDMVPDGGLWGQEYLVLGDGLVEKESFNNARKAYELASKNGAGPVADMKLIRDVPKEKQPDEAIQENMKALEVSQEKSPKAMKKARILWEQCVAKYPDFEYPYVHLAALINPNPSSIGSLTKGFRKQAKATKEIEPDEATSADTATLRTEKRAKAHEAESLLKKALNINPNFGLALLEMSSVKANLGDANGCINYANRFLKITGDCDPVGKITGENSLALAKVLSKTSTNADSEDKTKDASEIKKASRKDQESASGYSSKKRAKVKSVKELKEFDERFESSSAKPTMKEKSRQKTFGAAATANKSEGDDWNESNSASKPVEGMKKFGVSTKSTSTAVPPTQRSTSTKPPTATKAVSTTASKSAPSATQIAAEKHKKKQKDWMKFTPDDTDW